MKYEIPKSLKLFLEKSWIYFAIAFVIAGAGSIILNILFPPKPSTFHFTWNGILMFMGIAAGIGWIIHGTGFLLVRVK